MNSMDKKVIVVTGTSSGLGMEIAKTLLESGLYSVIGISRRTSDLASFFPDLYRHINNNLLNIDLIPNLASQVLKISPNIYGLVNNAAIGKDGLLPTFHNSDIQNSINLNLVSPIILTKYLVRPMLVSKVGRVINISSIVARSGFRGLSVYSASKAGLEAFTRSFAREVGPKSITVNCVSPGFLETEMSKSLGTYGLEKIKRRAALNRFPSLKEVSSTVKFLMSEEASGITGSIFTVDAGNLT
jgi:3-oxoacyl-[acyl-carrier protein] reductase